MEITRPVNEPLRLADVTLDDGLTLDDRLAIRVRPRRQHQGDGHRALEALLAE